MERIKRAKGIYVAVSAVMILVGAVLMLFPGISLLTLCYLIGAFMIVFGAARIVAYFSKDLFRLAFQFDLALGIFCALAGILILVHPGNIMRLLPVIIGLFILIDGVFKLQTAMDARRFGLARWYGIMILAILTCIFGLILIIDPFAGSEAMMMLFGAAMIVDGIQNLCVVLYTVKTVKKVKKNLQDEIMEDYQRLDAFENDNWREIK